MDAKQVDQLARQLSTRRTALGALLAGLLLPLEAAARKQGKGKQHNGHDKRHKKKKAGKGTDKGRTTAQAEPCWRAGACTVSKGSNVSQCDLAGYTAPDPLDCTRCNLSRANLRGADLTGVNFTRANLSGACLVDADFTGATFANNTNLYNAIFCNTRMPDGSINDSGCASGTNCCPTQSCVSNADCGPCGRCSSGRCAAVPNLSLACDGSPLRIVRAGVACTNTKHIGACVDGVCSCFGSVYDAASNQCRCTAENTATCLHFGSPCCEVEQVCTDGLGLVACIACP